MKNGNELGFESLLDEGTLTDEQASLASDASNQACDPCDCDTAAPGGCRCN
jgi:hypothetical protein